MARFVSIGGDWNPQKVHHINPNAKMGENPIYEGPEPDAQHILDKNGGIMRRNDSMTSLKSASNREGYGKEVEKYTSDYLGIDLDENRKRQERIASEVIPTNSYDNVARKKSTKQESGGYDYSGQGKHMSGDFRDPEGVSSDELNSRSGN